MRYNLNHIKLISALKEKNTEQATEYLMEVLHEINSNYYENYSNINKINEKLEKLEEDLHNIKEGFPSGDARGHRAYHERMMRDQEQSAKIKEQIMKEVIQKGILIAISLIIGALGLKFGFNFMGV